MASSSPREVACSASPRSASARRRPASVRTPSWMQSSSKASSTVATSGRAADTFSDMPQIAGFRGALWDASKVELGKVVASPVTGVQARLASGELVRDPSRAMYRYHQTFTHQGRTVTRQTLVCAVRLEPWTDGQIRPHEQTDPTARDAATAAIIEAGAHTEPVFAGYRDAAREVERLFRSVETQPPTIEVTTPDGTIHRLWRV